MYNPATPRQPMSRRLLPCSFSRCGSDLVRLHRHHVTAFHDLLFNLLSVKRAIMHSSQARRTAHPRVCVVLTVDTAVCVCMFVSVYECCTCMSLCLLCMYNACVCYVVFNAYVCYMCMCCDAWCVCACDRRSDHWECDRVE